VLLATKGQKLDESKCLLKFKVKGPVNKPETKAVTKEQRSKEAKSFWNAFFSAQAAVQKDAKSKGLK